jgi:hypothetical protein
VIPSLLMMMMTKLRRNAHDYLRILFPNARRLHGTQLASRTRER